MSQSVASLKPFDALIGTWTTEATHPLFAGVVPGTVTCEWLEGGHFLLQRSRNDNELFPDALGVLRFWGQFPEFAQRFSATVGPESFEGQWQLAPAAGDWQDDLKVTYRRPE